MPALEYVFHPRSIAVAGVSGNPPNSGYRFLKALLSLSFNGPIYPLNPKGGEVLGRKVYPGLKDVSDTVDYVVTSIPARSTIEFMKDCVAKGVKVVQLFTSGFKEMGQEGARLEAELVGVARQGGIRILGPNCLGIYCPRTGLSFAPGFPGESGSFAFLSQSGGNAVQIVELGTARGLRFSKVVSYGNAADLNETDFLEYCAEDPDTEIIGAYIEGIRDGRRFLRVLRETNRRKPVVILKSGRTSAGTRAISSHTGALIGNTAAWDAVFRQTRAVRVYSIDELLDVVFAFKCLPGLRGRGVGIVGVGGGASVQASDDCETRGLTVPALPEEIQQRLRKFTYYSSDAGSSFNNPVDSPLVLFSPERFAQILDIIADCPEIDLLIGNLGIDTAALGIDIRSVLLSMCDGLITFRKAHSKPVVMAINPAVTEIMPETASEIRRKSLANGIAVYPSMERAANAISKVVEYREKTSS